MSIHEQQPFNHAPEKIPAIVRKAVKFVPVDEYLQVRFQRGRSCSDAEYEQLYKAEDLLQTLAKKRRKSYSLTDNIHFSVARHIVAGISLPKYLAARHEVLEAGIGRTTRLIHLEEESFFRDETKLEEINDRLRQRQADLNLTNKVIAAAKISDSSAA